MSPWLVLVLAVIWTIGVPVLVIKLHGDRNIAVKKAIKACEEVKAQANYSTVKDQERSQAVVAPVP